MDLPLIQRKYISVHTFTKRGFVSIDVYSCKEFDKDAAKNILLEVFKPKNVEEHYLIGDYIIPITIFIDPTNKPK